jgi:hypothetical protein
MSYHCIVFRPGHVAWLNRPGLESTAVSSSSCVLSSSRREKYGISTAYVFVHDALSKDARKNGDNGATSFQSVLLNFASPSKYEVAGQSEEYHSNHHLC